MSWEMSDHDAWRAEAESRLEQVADTLRPLVAAGDAQVAAGRGEHVGVHIATLRRLLALAEGREA